MNFGGNTGNNREQTNVNTRGVQLMNSAGFYPSTFLIGFWNDMLSFKVHPTLEKSKQTNNKVFNYDEVVNTALTLEKAVVLLQSIREDVIPAILKDEEIFKGVRIRDDSLVGVGTKKINDQLSSYFAIYTGISEETRKPNVAIWYEFKTSYTIDNYDPATGDCQKSKPIHSELLLFAKILDAAIAAMSNAEAHASRTVDKFFRDRLMGALGEIGSKMGVSVGTQSGGGYNGRRGGGNDIFSSVGSKGSLPPAKDELPDFDAPMRNMENISDIEDFMN